MSWLTSLHSARRRRTSSQPSPPRFTTWKQSRMTVASGMPLGSFFGLLPSASLSIKVSMLKKFWSRRLRIKTNNSGTNTGFSVNLESPSRYCMYGFSWMAWMVFLSLKFSTCFTIKAPTTMRAGLLPAPQWLFLRRLLYSFSILAQGRRSASLTQRLDLLNPERERLLEFKQVVYMVL